MTPATMGEPTCPRCGDLFDGERNDGTPAKIGDYTICARCACPLRFGADLKLVKLTLEEVDNLPPEMAIKLADLARWAVSRSAP